MKFSSSAFLTLQSYPKLIRRSGAVFNQQLAILQSFTEAFIPILSTTTFSPKLVNSTTYDFLSAILFVSNHLGSSYHEGSTVVAPAKSPLSDICRTLGNPDVIHALVALTTEHNPTMDALREMIFKEALLSGNVRLTTLMLSQFKLDLADSLPGPWPQDFYGARFTWLPGRDFITARPPLQVAIESSNVELVKLLLSYGASADIRGAFCCDMMMVAVCRGSEDIVHMLLQPFQQSLVPALLICLRHNLNTLADILWAAVKTSDERLMEALTEKDKSNILSAATHSGHIRIMTDVLEGGAGVNALDELDMSPLQEAARSRVSGVQAINLLIEWGAEIDYRLTGDDFIMPTALQISLCEGTIEAAELLISAGADPNAERVVDHNDILGWPETDCLGIAIECERGYPIVQLLLQAGARPTAQSLSAAVNCNASDIIQLLLDINTPLSIDVLFSAADIGNTDMVTRCLNAGFDVNHLKDLESPLLRAAKGPSMMEDYLDERTYDILLDSGADVNMSGTWLSALQWAIRGRKNHLISLLLEKGSDCSSGVLVEAVNSKDSILLNKILDAVASRTDNNESFTSGCLGHEALNKAFHEKNETMASILVHRGINLRKPCAARMFRPLSLPLMESLLAHGLPANLSGCCQLECCEKGFLKWHLQPVQQLACTGNNDAIRLFLKHGANPNLFSHEEVEAKSGVWMHMSALGSAAAGGRMTTVNILLDVGAEVNQPALGTFGRTPLQSAVQSGRIEIVRRLLEKGADVNAQPAKDAGVTALQAAAIGGYITIAAELIEHGAEVNAPPAEKNGRSALEAACEYGRIDMVELLINAGADLEGTQYNNGIALAKGNGFNAVARFLRRRKEEVQMNEFVIFPADTPPPSPL